MFYPADSSASNPSRLEMSFSFWLLTGFRSMRVSDTLLSYFIIKNWAILCGSGAGENQWQSVLSGVDSIRFDSALLYSEQWILFCLFFRASLAFSFSSARQRAKRGRMPEQEQKKTKCAARHTGVAKIRMLFIACFSQKLQKKFPGT